MPLRRTWWSLQSRRDAAHLPTLCDGTSTKTQCLRRFSALHQHSRYSICMRTVLAIVSAFAVFGACDRQPKAAVAGNPSALQTSLSAEMGLVRTIPERWQGAWKYANVATSCEQPDIRLTAIRLEFLKNTDENGMARFEADSMIAFGTDSLQLHGTLSTWSCAMCEKRDRPESFTFSNTGYMQRCPDVSTQAARNPDSLLAVASASNTAEAVDTETPESRGILPSAIDWNDEPGYTVILSSELNEEQSRAFMYRARTEGINASLLWSSDFSSLRPGYWVVYTGRYRDSRSALAAQRQLRAQGFRNAYARFVRK